MTICQIMKNISLFIKKRLDAVDMTQRQLSIKSGLNESMVNGILIGKTNSPQFKNVQAILEALNCRIEIITPDDDNYQNPDAYTEIPLLGVAEAGIMDGFDTIHYDNEVLNVPRPFDGYAAIRIDGISMQPVYNHGDAVLIKPKEFTEVHEVIGHDAICELADGNALLKKVTPGENGTFTLLSYHPAYQPQINVPVRKFHKVVACLKQPNF